MFVNLAAIAASLVAAQAIAESTSPQPDLTREQARERADQLFDRFDLNHDGIVTRGEARQLGTRLMMIRASTGRDPAQGLGGHTLSFLKHRFAGVEAVTKEQFERAFLDHFDEMDANRDGVLSAAERAGQQPDRASATPAARAKAQ